MAARNSLDGLNRLGDEVNSYHRDHFRQYNFCFDLLYFIIPSLKCKIVKNKYL